MCIRDRYTELLCDVGCEAHDSDSKNPIYEGEYGGSGGGAGNCGARILSK